MAYDPCEICKYCPPLSADKGCVIVRGHIICDDCWAKRIFVFGSNLAGRHGKGAALDARIQYGAEYGVGVGRTGNAYAIPTKDFFIKRLHISLIAGYVTQFIDDAKNERDKPFFLTRVGCGLAGFTDAQIAPLFKGVSSNVIVPDEWRQYVQP